MSLIIGILLALIIKVPEDWQKKLKKWSGIVLQCSIVLLAASLNFNETTQTGLTGLMTTFFSIVLVFIIGFLLFRFFKIDQNLFPLITSGTAICGGSAIGAIAPIIKADHLSIAISLGIVFILNTLALIVFPPIAEMVQLTQTQFGTWAALAIHDTSSVVASCQIFGEESLKIGTTLKLSRALWIIPLSLIFSFLTKNKDNKITIPWFILFFILNSLIFTYFTELNFLIAPLKNLGKWGFSLTLLMIGLTLNKTSLQSLKKESLYFATGLWLINSLATFIYVYYFI